MRKECPMNLCLLVKKSHTAEIWNIAIKTRFRRIVLGCKIKTMLLNASASCIQIRPFCKCGRASSDVRWLIYALPHSGPPAGRTWCRLNSEWAITAVAAHATFYVLSIFLTIIFLVNTCKKKFNLPGKIDRTRPRWFR